MEGDEALVPDTGELLSLDVGRTGVIIGLAADVPTVHAADMRAQLERLFPGVTFAIVTQCSALVAFTFDDEPDMHEGA